MYPRSFPHKLLNLTNHHYNNPTRIPIHPKLMLENEHLPVQLKRYYLASLWLGGIEIDLIYLDQNIIFLIKHLHFYPKKKDSRTDPEQLYEDLHIIRQ